MISKNYLLNIAIGLQKVDGLENSSYFKEISSKYLSGYIEANEFINLIIQYYANKKDYDNKQYEADMVASRMLPILEEDNFILSSSQLFAIHNRLFKDVYDFAGQVRDVNISKKEWILNQQSVLYADYRDIEEMLEYDFKQEKKFDYVNTKIDQKIEHIADFISNLWQIHPFKEGNTRTIAIFLIKYLRTFGLNISNNVFKESSWYFRNALVRANYRDPINDVYENTRYLIMFLRKMILNEEQDLSNKLLKIGFDIINFTSRDANILKAMKDNPKITIDEIAKQTDLSIRTVKYCIANLKTKNILKRMGGKQKGYWLVKVDI